MTSQSAQKTAFTATPYLVLDNQGQILSPMELTRDRHILGRDRTVADLVVPDQWLIISNCHATLQKEGEDYRIYDGDGSKPSTNGLFINRQRITARKGYLLENGTEIQIGNNPQNQILLTYSNPASSKNRTLPKNRSIDLKQRSVLLGRSPNANLQLDAPIVSQRHATIEADAQGRYILQDYSTHGVFINKQRVNGAAVLMEGAMIQIGPFTLVRRRDELIVLDQGNNIRLDACNLVLTVKDDKGQRRLLDDISLVVEPGQFVALVGGSGTGKSTLLRSLLGIEPIQGQVLLNGDDLRTNFNIYRTQIGYVPQEDIIHRDLTVAEVLTYGAQLRLPSDSDINQEVDKTLAEIEMSDRRHILVRQLSGGQRKRVSIGVELLANPKLFFLDEPTSGLDPGLDQKMMQLLRKFADQNRAIILVTHATSNIKLCDRLAFLGRGGRLCYFGSPAEAIKFFNVAEDNFAYIYNELEPSHDAEEQVKQWRDRFQNSTYYQQYIGDRLSTDNQPYLSTSPPKPVQISPGRQLLILQERYLKLILRDRLYLGLSLLTAPIGIALIPLAIKDKHPLILPPESDPTLAPLALRVLFVFTCAAIWVGLASSLHEIVKESAIYLRERLVNLGLFPYLTSKVTILSALALVQTLFIAIVILIGFKSPHPDLIPWPLGFGITTFLTLLTSISLGLLISSVVKNSSQANSALPLVLLPQIIFSGVLFKMTGIAEKISWFMLSRWSIGALGTIVNVNGMVPEPIYAPDGTILPLPFEKTPVYDATWQNLTLNWGLLCLHAIIYLALTFWMQKRKDIRPKNPIC